MQYVRTTHSDRFGSVVLDMIRAQTMDTHGTAEEDHLRKTIELTLRLHRLITALNASPIDVVQIYQAHRGSPVPNYSSLSNCPLYLSST